MEEGRKDERMRGREKKGGRKKNTYLEEGARNQTFVFSPNKRSFISTAAQNK